MSSSNSSALNMLKRPRGESMPALPQISHDLTLDVFTHISLRRETPRVEDYGDNERLSIIGGVVLRSTIVQALFDRRPMLLSSEFSFRCEEATSIGNIAKWAELYGMKRKLRCHPSILATLDDPKESALIFQAFVGALYEDHGQTAVTEWITQLLELDEDSSSAVSYSIDPVASKGSPPPKRVKSEEDFISLTSPASAPYDVKPYSYGLSTLPPSTLKQFPFGSQSVPSRTAPPSTTTSIMPTKQFMAAASSVQSPYPSPLKQPYMQSSPSTYQTPSSSMLMKQYMAQAPPQPIAQQHPPQFSNPLAPAQPNLPFLPLFNQTAAQRKVSVEYPASFSGPPHAGQWNVQCVVNGIAKGFGRGNSKQVAKEEAARQAFYAMGWT